MTSSCPHPINRSTVPEILKRFGRCFGRPIRTEQGLRTAVFHARERLAIAIAANERYARCP